MMSSKFGTLASLPTKAFTISCTFLRRSGSFANISSKCDVSSDEFPVPSWRVRARGGEFGKRGVCGALPMLGLRMLGLRTLGLRKFIEFARGFRKLLLIARPRLLWKAGEDEPRILGRKTAGDM